VLPSGIISSSFQEKILKFVELVDTITKINVYAVSNQISEYFSNLRINMFFFSANCYSKVKAETTVLQEQMIQELGIKPVEKEVAILYQGEKNQFNDEFFKVNYQQY
jgi:hypothetical protein